MTSLIDEINALSHGLVFTSFTGFEVTAALFRYCYDIRNHDNCSALSTIARTKMIYTSTQYFRVTLVKTELGAERLFIPPLQCPEGSRPLTQRPSVCLDVTFVTLDVIMIEEMIGNEAFQIQ